MKTLIGIVTFGNLSFTKLTIRSIRETTREPFDLFVVVGKPDDAPTAVWLRYEKIPFLQHESNRGFPASLNDIYDYAWGSAGGPPAGPGSAPGPQSEQAMPRAAALSRSEQAMPRAAASGTRAACAPYDNLILAGNDIVPYPDAVDALIRCARETDYEWIASSQYDVKSLVRDHPETARFFTGENFLFNEWGEKPWEIHRDFRAPFIEPNVIKDVRNLCLFKRSVFEKIGYADANFWPGGYYEDNDYCKRGNAAGLKTCALHHSAYFHFWSRTIHQEGGSTTSELFNRNARYYQQKWGGPFDGEAYAVPFNGTPFPLCKDVMLPAALKIEGRADEGRIAEYWRAK